MAKKILIIDDDWELCQELAEILRSEGYSVDNVSNSSDGEALFNKERYDMGIFDYKMTGQTGVELLRKIKEKDPQCPVIMISGRPFIENILEKENVIHLVSGILPKPFDIATLLQKVKALAPQ